MEKWKPVKNYEGYYEVSTHGRIKSIDHITKTAIKHNTHVVKRGKMLKLNMKKSGYLTFDASKENKIKTILVHRAVAEAFIPNIDGKPCVNHKNANKTDNRVENLEWATYQENTEHASSLGLLYGGLRKKIKCVETGMIFPSSYQAAEWLNETKYKHSKNKDCMSRNIRAVCSGKRHSAFGYRWRDLA